MAINQILSIPDWQKINTFTSSTPEVGFSQIYPGPSNYWYVQGSNGSFVKRLAYDVQFGSGLSTVYAPTESFVDKRIDVVLGRGLTFAYDGVGSAILVSGLTFASLSISNSWQDGYVLTGASSGQFQWTIGGGGSASVAGTSGSIAKFTSPTSVGNSIMSEFFAPGVTQTNTPTASYVKVGTISPTNTQYEISLASEEGIVMGKNLYFGDNQNRYIGLTNSTDIELQTTGDFRLLTYSSSSFKLIDSKNSLTSNSKSIEYLSGTFATGLVSMNLNNQKPSLSVGVYSGGPTFGLNNRVYNVALGLSGSIQIQDGSQGYSKVLMSTTQGQGVWTSMVRPGTKFFLPFYVNDGIDLGSTLTWSSTFSIPAAGPGVTAARIYTASNSFSIQLTDFPNNFGLSDSLVNDWTYLIPYGGTYAGFNSTGTPRNMRFLMSGGLDRKWGTIQFYDQNEYVGEASFAAATRGGFVKDISNNSSGYQTGLLGLTAIHSTAKYSRHNSYTELLSSWKPFGPFLLNANQRNVQSQVFPSILAPGRAGTYSINTAESLDFLSYPGYTFWPKVLHNDSLAYQQPQNRVFSEQMGKDVWLDTDRFAYNIFGISGNRMVLPNALNTQVIRRRNNTYVNSMFQPIMGPTAGHPDSFTTSTIPNVIYEQVYNRMGYTGPNLIMDTVIGSWMRLESGIQNMALTQSTGLFINPQFGGSKTYGDLGLTMTLARSVGVQVAQEVGFLRYRPAGSINEAYDYISARIANGSTFSGINNHVGFFAQSKLRGIQWDPSGRRTYDYGEFIPTGSRFTGAAWPTFSVYPQKPWAFYAERDKSNFGGGLMVDIGATFGTPLRGYVDIQGLTGVYNSSNSQTRILFDTDGSQVEVAPSSYGPILPQVMLRPSAQGLTPTGLTDGAMWYRSGSLNFYDSGQVYNLLTPPSSGGGVQTIRISATHFSGITSSTTYFATQSNPTIATYSGNHLYLVDFFRGNTMSVNLNVNNLGTFSIFKDGVGGLTSLSSGDIVGSNGTGLPIYYLLWRNGFFQFYLNDPYLSELSGNGISNYVPVWTNSKVLKGTSSIYISNGGDGNVGINTKFIPNISLQVGTTSLSPRDALGLSGSILYQDGSQGITGSVMMADASGKTTLFPLIIPGPGLTYSFSRVSASFSSGYLPLYVGRGVDGPGGAGPSGSSEYQLGPIMTDQFGTELSLLIRPQSQFASTNPIPSGARGRSLTLVVPSLSTTLPTGLTQTVEFVMEWGNQSIQGLKSFLNQTRFTSFNSSNFANIGILNTLSTDISLNQRIIGMGRPFSLATANPNFTKSILTKLTGGSTHFYSRAAFTDTLASDIGAFYHISPNSSLTRNLSSVLNQAIGRYTETVLANNYTTIQTGRDNIPNFIGEFDFTKISSTSSNLNNPRTYIGTYKRTEFGHNFATASGDYLVSSSTASPVLFSTSSVNLMTGLFVNNQIGGLNWSYATATYSIGVYARQDVDSGRVFNAFDFFSSRMVSTSSLSRIDNHVGFYAESKSFGLTNLDPTGRNLFDDSASYSVPNSFSYGWTQSNNSPWAFFAESDKSNFGGGALIMGTDSSIVKSISTNSNFQTILSAYRGGLPSWLVIQEALEGRSQIRLLASETIAQSTIRVLPTLLVGNQFSVTTNYPTTNTTVVTTYTVAASGVTAQAAELATKINSSPQGYTASSFGPTISVSAPRWIGSAINSSTFSFTNNQGGKFIVTPFTGGISTRQPLSVSDGDMWFTGTALYFQSNGSLYDILAGGQGGVGPAGPAGPAGAAGAAGSAGPRGATGATGVVSVGAFSQNNFYANGANLSTTGVLTLGAADSTNPGLVHTGAQTFSGDKFFRGDVYVGPTNTNGIFLFDGGGTSYSGFIGPTGLPGNIIYRLPATAALERYLKTCTTDGTTWNLVWATAAGGGGGGSLPTSEIGFGNLSGTSITSNSNFKFFTPGLNLQAANVLVFDTPATNKCQNIVIGGGSHTHSTSHNSSIIGGSNHRLCSGLASSIIGGCNNRLFGTNSTILGGSSNFTCDSCGSSIVGGASHIIQCASLYSSIIGGCDNCVDNSDFSSTLGGQINLLCNSNESSIIGGGSNNICSSPCSSIISSRGSNINPSLCPNAAIKSGVIMGGDNLLICGGGSNFASIINGNNQCIVGTNSNNTSILGGINNKICEFSSTSTIIGGEDNTIFRSCCSLIMSSKSSRICLNTISANTTLESVLILGGNNNLIFGTESKFTTIINGNNACIFGCNNNFATLLGGSQNRIGTASHNSTIIGGENHFICCSARSAIIGGASLTLTASNDTVLVPQLQISSVPSDNNQTWLLAWNNTDRKLYYREVSSLPSSPGPPGGPGSTVSLRGFDNGSGFGILDTHTGGFPSGATISYSNGFGNLTFSAASSVNPGMVSTVTQSFKGPKNFIDNVFIGTPTGTSSFGSGIFLHDTSTFSRYTGFLPPPFGTTMRGEPTGSQLSPVNLVYQLPSVGGQLGQALSIASVATGSSTYTYSLNWNIPKVDIGLTVSPGGTISLTNVLPNIVVNWPLVGSNFCTVSISDNNKLFEVTTGDSVIYVDVPTAAQINALNTGDRGFEFRVKKRDAGSGVVAINIPEGFGTPNSTTGFPYSHLRRQNQIMEFKWNASLNNWVSYMLDMGYIQPNTVVGNFNTEPGFPEEILVTDFNDTTQNALNFDQGSFRNDWLSGVIYSSIDPITRNLNTATEQALLNLNNFQFIGTNVLPTYSLVRGKALRLKISGTHSYTNVGSTTITFKLQNATSTATVSNIQNLNTIGQPLNTSFEIDYSLKVRFGGQSGSVYGFGNYYFEDEQTPAAAIYPIHKYNTGFVNANLSVANQLIISATGTSNASITINSAIIERLA